MDKCASEIRVEFTKVKGHSGQKYNEMVDQLAKEGMQKMDADDGISLYNEQRNEHNDFDLETSYEKSTIN